MANYSTVNLVPAHETLVGLPKENGLRGFEMTEDEPAPPEMGGGYLVGMRGWLVWSGRRIQVYAMYHLLRRNEQWRVEEIYILALDRQPVERQIALSTDYDLLKHPTGSPPARPSEQFGKQGMAKVAPASFPNPINPAPASSTSTINWKGLGRMTGLGGLLAILARALGGWYLTRKGTEAKS